MKIDSKKLFTINESSRVPKYQQVIDSVKNNITQGKFKIDQKLPSINQLSEEFYLSRDTVEKSYSILKKQKIISSIPGKGFYITNTNFVKKTKILFLINKMSSYKMRIYNSFLETIGLNAHIDLHIYHCDDSVFVSLLKNNLEAYDYYIIMPHFKNNNQKHITFTEAAINEVNKIPAEKLVIIDNIKFFENENIMSVYQDFENDICEALQDGFDIIKKYKKLFLIYPEKSFYPYPKRILNGFRKFCSINKLDFDIIDHIYDDIILKDGDLFITIEESDLISLIKEIRNNEFEIGDDIGIISYNDTPLKELFGISVISTDFQFMGRKIGEMIVNNKKEIIKAPFKFLERNSV